MFQNFVQKSTRKVIGRLELAMKIVQGECPADSRVRVTLQDNIITFLINNKIVD